MLLSPANDTHKEECFNRNRHPDFTYLHLALCSLGCFCWFGFKLYHVWMVELYHVWGWCWKRKEAGQKVSSNRTGYNSHRARSKIFPLTYESLHVWSRDLSEAISYHCFLLSLHPLPHSGSFAGCYNGFLSGSFRVSAQMSPSP